MTSKTLNCGNIEEKKERLISILKNYDSLAIAFSGGVDSSYLLALSHKVMGKKVFAITAISPVHPAREIKFAQKFAASRKIRHVIIKSDEMSLPEFIANNRNRCYVCKKILFPKMLEYAVKSGVKDLVHGANVDDLNDFRPGFSAASESKIAAPLIDAGLSKKDIRQLSKNMNLETWNKPAMACLATRIPYGTSITAEILNKIEDAENALIDLGFSTCRVRHHGDLARIEVPPKDFKKILSKENMEAIIKTIKKAGYLYVTMDIEGYIQGSMNR
ncbi:MAG: ATP-dependent sacrificial sulfur transferase LarE [Proteobacteria bacterium]|nr:ATP-dependent sacrificial sulfur transferase LarE [Pseudomonadota bacterium]